MAYRTIGRAVAGFAAISLLSGCSEIEKIKDMVEDALGSANFGFPVDFADPNATYSAEIKVLDATRAPVKGASLAINGTTYASDANGLIKVDNLKVNQILSASVIAEGFMRGPVKLSYSKAGQGAAIVQLTPVEVSVVMDSSLGGTVAGQTVRATFQKDSFVRAAAPGSSPAFRPLAEEPYTGQVTVNLASLDVNSQVFEKTEDDGTLVLRSDVTPDRVPSGFFTNVGEDGIERSILPESVLAVEMYDEDGNPLQLAEGKEATIGLQLPTISGQSEGKSMNILSYDEESSVWRDDSICQVQPALGTDGEASGKKECVGQVSHFTLKTVATSGTLSTCVRMQFLLRNSVEEANKDNLRYQHMEVLTGVKNADDTYAIRANDTDYLTDASMCYHGSLNFVRTVVQFKTKTDGKLVEEYKTPWFLPSKRGIKAGTVPNEICAECSVLVYQQPEEEGKASGSTPVVQPVDADNDGYVAAKDCNDADATINPGAAEEICGPRGKDLNCDGVIPPTTINIPGSNATVNQITTWNTTYCTKANAGLTCVIKAAAETGGNALDDDCDGVIRDVDGDGEFGMTDSDGNGRIDDCNDFNAKVNQNATESDATPADDNCDGIASFDECEGVKNTCGANSTCSDESLTTVNAISCTCDEGYSLTDGVCTQDPIPDTTPPNTTIASGPTGIQSSGTTSSQFTFTCSESNCTFECRLDVNAGTGSYAACTSPKTITVSDGNSYTLNVRAKDAANNVDASPATRIWSVALPVSPTDVTPPAYTFVDNYIDFETPISTTTATLQLSCFDYEDSYPCTFEYSLGAPGSWQSVGSATLTLTDLLDGSTTDVYVRSTDAANNTDTIGTMVSITVALSGPGGGAVAQVASGKVASCMITAQGNLACWAGGEYCCATPNFTSFTGDWVAISIGDAASDESMSQAHFCGIRDTGALYCWSYNSNGQLGSGDTNNQSSITQVGSATWITVETGLENTCGIKTDGSLWCWGTNVYGELGTFPFNSQELSPAPVSGGLTGWSDVSMSDIYTCGIRGTGDMYCWGSNSNGQLGSGDNTSYTTPHPVSGAGWKQVATGPYAACAVKSNGTLWCWGSDMSNQIGVSAGDDSSTSPVQVGSATNWASVELGADHACAVKTTGTLWCWGYEGREQMGDGAGNTPLDVPTQIGAATDWLRLAAGRYLTLGIRGSEGAPAFYGWGWDWMGQTGTDAGTGVDCGSTLGPDCVVASPTQFFEPLP